MQVVLDGFEPESGEASSKRAAEQAAAQAFLARWSARMSETRCGFVALIGAPNAGKSTLLNALVGSKVSIVSRKAQTTRATVRGILVEGAAQIIFVDTPGLFAPKRRLDRAMLASAWGAAGDADALALLIDARQEIAAAGKSANAIGEATRAILPTLARAQGAEVSRPQQGRPGRPAASAGARRAAQCGAAVRRHLHDSAPRPATGSIA